MGYYNTRIDRSIVKRTQWFVTAAGYCGEHYGGHLVYRWAVVESRQIAQATNAIAFMRSFHCWLPQSDAVTSVS